MRTLINIIFAFAFTSMFALSLNAQSISNDGANNAYISQSLLSSLSLSQSILEYSSSIDTTVNSFNDNDSQLSSLNFYYRSGEDKLIIQMSSDAQEKGNLSVKNAMGEYEMNLEVEGEKVIVKTASFSPGTYMVNFVNNNGKSMTYRFTKN